MILSLNASINANIVFPIEWTFATIKSLGNEFNFTCTYWKILKIVNIKHSFCVLYFSDVNDNWDTAIQNLFVKKLFLWGFCHWRATQIYGT
jgi:hypothetical protein